MNEIGVIHNPFARRNLRKKHLAGELCTILQGKGTLIKTRHADELADVAEDCLKNKLPFLGINGGDGSIHAVLTSFASVYGKHRLPKILILRGGTMNTVAQSLGISGTPESILRKWVEKGLSARVRTMEHATLNVNGKIGFIAGAGVVTRFLDAYYEGHGRGVAKALSMVGKLVPGAVVGSESARQMFEKVPMNVVHEGRDLGKERYSAVLASTVREVGLGFKLTSRCYEKPGAFHLIAADVSPFSLVPRIVHLWSGMPFTHKGLLHHGPSEKAVIRHRGVLRWMMDGDMYETTDDLVISMGPTVEVVYV